LQVVGKKKDPLPRKSKKRTEVLSGFHGVATKERKIGKAWQETYFGKKIRGTWDGTEPIKSRGRKVHYYGVCNVSRGERRRGGLEHCVVCTKKRRGAAKEASQLVGY